MRKQTCLAISCLATLIVLFGLTSTQRVSNVLTQLRDSETLVQRCKDNLVGQIVGKLTTETRPQLNLSQVLQTLPSAPLLLPNMVFTPALRISKGRGHVSTVLGVPTVKRDRQSYLEETLTSLLENMSVEEMADTLIVVFVAETDFHHVTSISILLEEKFSEHLQSGLLEIISPPPQFYPDLTRLEETLGDSMDRVRWRSKQLLDFTFLMMYAMRRGTYYVQLEDDVITKRGFVSTMNQFALKMTAENKPWFIIDFCSLGFIGKMFKTVDLPLLSQFLLMFYKDKPVDWLLIDLLRAKMCRPLENSKNCLRDVWIQHSSSLFQHMGTHSSLSGKLQLLKDKKF